MRRSDIRSPWRTLGLSLILIASLLGMLSPRSVSLAEVTASPLEGSEKIAVSDKVFPDGALDFQIVLRNDSGENVLDASVVDVLDARLDFVDAAVEPDWAGSGSHSNGTVTFNLSVVPPTLPVTLTIQTQVKAGSFVVSDTVTNTATIDDGTNPLFATNTVEVTMAEFEVTTSQIDVPWNMQKFTQKGTTTISGRAWIGVEHPEFPETPVLQSISYVTGNDWYFIEWSDVPTAITYVLEEATDISFNNPTQLSASASSPYPISGKPAGTYYYRVKARNTSGESRWSNVEAVTVAPSAQFAADSLQPMMLTPRVVTADAPVVEINIKQVGSGIDSWVPLTQVVASTGSWWDWSYDWVLPVHDDPTQYVIQTRSKAAGDVYGDVDAITVTVENGTILIYMPVISRRFPPLPYAPTLTLSNNDGYGNYDLSWSYGHSDPYAPTSYRFQEATDANFTNLLVNEVRTSPQQFRQKSVGTYYYRVRGRNAYVSYGEGAWSNVIKVVVNRKGYFDDFSNKDSGWWRGTRQDGDRNVFSGLYLNGTYRTKIMLDRYSFNNYRMGIVPGPYTHTDNSYDVEVDHSFVRADDQEVDPSGGKAGVIFRAEQNTEHGYYERIFVFEWNFEGGCDMHEYTGIESYIPDVRFIEWDFGPFDYGNCVPAGYNQDINVRLEVRGSKVTAYVNDTKIDEFGSIEGGNTIGLMTGSWERTPVESAWDNFEVTEK